MQSLRTIKTNNRVRMANGLAEFIAGLLIIANISEVVSLIALTISLILAVLSIWGFRLDDSEPLDEMYYDNKRKAQQGSLLYLMIVICLISLIATIFDAITQIHLSVDFVGLSFAILGAQQLMESICFARYEKIDANDADD